MSNMREIAKHAGVSLTTVSRVFNNHPLVNDKTRKLVLGACQELDYAIDPKLQDAILSSKSGFTKKIAIVLIDNDLESCSYISWINHIIKECNKRHYQSIINSIDASVQNVYELPPILRDERCDGMCVTGRLTRECMEVLSALDIPGVVLGSYPESFITRNFSNITPRMNRNIENLLNKLQQTGVKELAYIDENPDNFFHRTNREYALEYAKSINLELNPENIFLGNGPMTGMLEKLKPFFRRNELPFDGALVPDERIAQEIDKLNFMHSELYNVPQIPIATLINRYHSGYENIFIFPDGKEQNQFLARNAVDLLFDEICRKNKGEPWVRKILTI